MKMKKFAAAAAASAMALSVMAVNASAAEYDAFLMFTDWDWLWGNWNLGQSGDAVVNGYGTYTVSISASETENSDNATNGAQIFCVDIVGGGAEFSVDNTIATIDSIKADGSDIKVDNSKIVYGDIEENGNFRIEIRNTYGVTGDAAGANYDPIDSESFSAADSIEVTFTLAPADGAEAAPAETEAAETEAAAEETAPAADSSTTSATTGNTSAAALAGIMAVAAAAIAASKRK
ncbi:MAG: hypothetical protein ACI4KF_02090 [Huintestinicola sp.]